MTGHDGRRCKITDRSVVWDRVGALTGAVFVGLTVVGFAIAGEPSAKLSDSAPAIAGAFEERADQAVVGILVGLAGLAFFIFFLGFLRERLRRSSDGVEWLISAAYGGGLVAVGMLLLQAVLGLATTDASGYDTEPAVAKTIFALLWNYIWVLAPPLFALSAGASAVIIRTAALPKWTGWVGLFAAVTMLMPWIGLFVFLIWVLLLSVVLSVQAWRPTHNASSS